ncbi:2-dehydropantoate 2-reductase [Candidatus Hydrogenisulfobacillus filiaventi]|uniref:2-dehydropantoate 2-reductase n=1 Tax=Candidatus Hydrogenisulfobacillus filiaventi TaxID=2707344 RepID=A0A6F8ZF38_9FIRM|nr:2-dehydropantoate 2-reductase [Bacillota bacterium]CAB1128280.1 2-dehydropantoate 2-reductase [Candidatus Hydrogenisulfobacillus filiaventi]
MNEPLPPPVILGTGALARFWARALRVLDPVLVGREPPVVRLAPTARAEPEPEWVPRFRSWQEPWIGPGPGVVWVLVKAPAAETAAAWLAQLPAPPAAVVSLMNGMGYEGVLGQAAGSERLVLGVTTDAVTLDRNTNLVVVNARGETLLGNPAGRGPAGRRARQAVEGVLKTAAGVRWRWLEEADMERARWTKLVQNAVINPLSALTGRPNGELPDQIAWRLAPALVGEVLPVAARRGVRLGAPAEVLQAVEALARRTGPNRSSMLQDVLHRRPTEVDYINGFVVREAGRWGLAAPTHATLTTLVRALG